MGLRTKININYECFCRTTAGGDGLFCVPKGFIKTTYRPTVDYLCCCSFPMSPASTQAKLSVVYIGHYMVDEWKTAVGGSHSVLVDFSFRPFRGTPKFEISPQTDNLNF